MTKLLVIDRPPRIQPELPFDEIEIPSPPDKGQSGWEQLAQMALPLVMIVAFVLMAGMGGGRRRADDDSHGVGRGGLGRGRHF